MPAKNQTYLISFEGVSTAEAGSHATELRQVLLDSSEDVSVEIVRHDDSSQNFGDVLQVVLAAPAAVIAARALRDWLRMRHSASIEIRTIEGHLVAKNITSKDAASLVDKLQRY